MFYTDEAYRRQEHSFVLRKFSYRVLEARAVENSKACESAYSEHTVLTSRMLWKFVPTASGCGSDATNGK